MLDVDYIWSIVVFIGGLILYISFKIPDYRKRTKLGLLLYAYIRDISKLLTYKLEVDWDNLSMPEKLDVLKSVYDLIEEISKLKIDKLNSNVDLTSEIDKINRGRQ